MESNPPSILPMQHPQNQPQPLPPQQIPLYPPFAPVDLDTSCTGAALVQEETAENKTCTAEIEVKMLGFDVFIKILTRRRPGQLIRMVAALEEEMQFAIMHTNITTIDQTVLYSFTIKVLFFLQNMIKFFYPFLIIRLFYIINLHQYNRFI
jgi:hypothetical protein